MQFPLLHSHGIVFWVTDLNSLSQTYLPLSAKPILSPFLAFRQRAMTASEIGLNVKDDQDQILIHKIGQTKTRSASKSAKAILQPDRGAAKPQILQYFADHGDHACLHEPDHNLVP